MTKSEIEQNAEEYTNETCKDCYISAYSECKNNCKKQAYLAGALSRQPEIDEAKEIIKALLRVTYGEGWNYSLDVKIRAEQFLNKGE